jgi:hypothetical protein
MSYKQEWTKPEINFVLREYRKGFSRKEIAKSFNQKFKAHRSPDSIKHCIDTHGLDIEKHLPKVLILDIETAPMVSYTWGLWDQNVGLNQIKHEGGILSWSAKWLGNKEIAYKDVKGDMSKEKQLLLPLWKMMDEADIILGQSSNKFDIKKLNAKFLEHKMGSPSAYKKIDTLLLAKKHFSFVSNKLEWMSKKFCKLKKLTHGKFPGFSLWSECLNGNKEAWKEMRVYNTRDVEATEELFLVLAQFDKTEIVTSAVRTYYSNKKKK